MPLTTPLYLWYDGTIRTMASTATHLWPGTYSIPKVRHVSGPCWQAQLGDIKNTITVLQEKSARFGWALCYLSHEAMDAEMRRCDDEELREACFAIDAEMPTRRAGTADHS